MGWILRPPGRCQCCAALLLKPARALGLGDIIGSLEVGKQADLILMDLAGPNLTPLFHDPVVTLVYNANRYDVCAVMVAGHFTVRGRKLQTMSEKEIMANGTKKQLCRCTNATPVPGF